MQQLLIALTLLFSSMLAAQNSTRNNEAYNNIEISVVNVTSDKGTIEFALYTEDGFLKEPFSTQSGTINNKLSTVTFENVPAGTYAVVCFHDANENKRLDFEMNGMPIENYGSSNNVFEMGPPVFENSKFEHGTKESKLEIKF